MKTRNELEENKIQKRFFGNKKAKLHENPLFKLDFFCVFEGYILYKKTGIVKLIFRVESNNSEFLVFIIIKTSGKYWCYSKLQANLDNLEFMYFRRRKN